MPMLATRTLDQSELEASTIRPPDYQSPATRVEVLKQFDANYKAARQHLVNKTDAEFAAAWTLKHGGKEVFTAPKAMVMRNFVLNHMIHHRGQLMVYFRMLGVPVPSIYGPSGDEQT
jgi:uncharacterized damage-inducible protein DinB